LVGKDLSNKKAEFALKSGTVVKSRRAEKHLCFAYFHAERGQLCFGVAMIFNGRAGVGRCKKVPQLKFDLRISQKN